MKASLGIFLLCCLFFMSYGQRQKNDVSKVLSFNVPAGVTKLESDDLKSRLSTRKNSVMDTKGSATHYMLGGIIFLLNGGEATMSTNFLEERKKNLDEYHLSDEKPVYKSEIKKINNYKVFVTERDQEHFNYYSFQAIDNSNSKTAVGTIEYPKADSVQAKALLDYLLKNMRFK